MGSSERNESLESSGTEIGDRTGPLARVREWILVEGDRLLITILLSSVTFFLLLALNELEFIAFVNSGSMTRLASGMIAGTFSLVTLVVSINQLILSQEFATAGEVRDELDGVMDFRHDLEERTGVPASPAAPTRILEVLVEAVRRRADELAEAVAGHEDAAFEARVNRYVASVRESTDRLDDTLEHTSSNTFNAVSASLQYDNGRQVYVARTLRGRYADELSDEQREAVDELIGTLQLFDVAQEHFKTTYLQRELTRFSQLTIYSGFPAILSAIIVALVYADFGGASINVASLPVVVSALITVVISPLALLVSYILRTATVARRSASVGPMLPQKDPDDGSFEGSLEEGQE
ncbi:hypothetical protein HALLA_06955 [Halostagnicola larsenii XH-48]|uniref:Uncharacterized protein n=1 Tax=Halostagnicola larsenii XH-48 TaxID=797299 RepID=W0JJ43_9EURY|nr:hypothetical protein [Halostagnicola larsenii]AHF98628.1 hypothetical protein HALLA_06955 [Halostagnicola larsenii XH-48]